MDPETAAEFSPLVLCGRCGEPIIEEQAVEAHVHHDSSRCDWICPFEIDDSDYELRISFHEVVCEKQIVYHGSCCMKCGYDMAGV